MDALTHLPNAQGPQFVLANPQEVESSFDFWGVLNRRKWLVFLGLVTGMALGGLYFAQAEIIYESEARVKIEPKNQPKFRMTQDLGGPTNFNEASTRHDRFMGQFNIVNKCLSGLKDLHSFDDIAEDKVVQYVIKNLEIQPDREEPVLYELTYRCNKADDARTVLNTLIATYREELDEQYKNENDQYITLLRQVRTEFNTNYQRLQKELSETIKKHDAPVVGPGGTNMHQLALTALGSTIQQCKAELASLTADRERINDALERDEMAWSTLAYNLIQEGKIKDVSKDDQDRARIELAVRSLEVEMGTLKQKYGPSHPEVKGVKTQIDYWKKTLEELATNGGIALNDPEMMLQRYLLLVNQQINDQQKKLEHATNDYVMHDQEATRLAGVQREIDTIKEQMTDVNDFIKMAQRKIVEIDPSMELNNRGRHEGFIFDTLMDATDGKQVWPILPVILGIGALLGMLGGFGLGCLVELADKTFHNPDEIMKQLHIPLIGHIPVIGQSKRYLVENSLIEPIVCTYHRPKSQMSEAFRAVRTALYFNTQGKQHSVIQITSPTPGDGKSTLASNLAVSIAQSGKRVLLVDGDMRRPRQAATFGISSKTGFATVLSGESQWRDVVYECEEIEGLTVMPCGSKPNNPAELCSSPQIKELIEEMRLEFDFVIIDTPPMLAVTDACPIAARVDGVVLCIRIKKNVRVSAERATEMLANLGANCLGLVVNGVGAQSGYGSQYTYGAYRAGYSYNGYGYGYGYGYGAGKYYDDEKKGAAASPNGGMKHIEARRTEQHPPVA